MFCINCGADYEDKDFCSNCGQAKPLEEKVPEGWETADNKADNNTEINQPDNGQQINEADTFNVNTQNSQYNPYAANAQNYQQPQQPAKKGGSAQGYAIFGFVVACISLIILLFDFVIISLWVFIMPVLSFTAIPKDKRNGVQSFTLAIVFNIISIIVGIICTIIYFIAVGQS